MKPELSGHYGIKEENGKLYLAHKKTGRLILELDEFEIIIEAKPESFATLTAKFFIGEVSPKITP